MTQLYKRYSLEEYINKNVKLVPISGKPLDAETFVRQLVLKNEDTLDTISATDLFRFAHILNTKYNICSDVKFNEYMKNISTLADDIVEDLYFDQKRKILSILVEEVLDNNESNST